MPSIVTGWTSGASARTYRDRLPARAATIPSTDAKTPIRWQPLIETSIKLGGLTWLLTSFLAWLLLNAYLGAIGQRGVPLDLAGTWAALVLMGALLTVALAAIGSVFVIGGQMMQALHPNSQVPRETRIMFFCATSVAVGVLLLLERKTGSILLGSALALPSGIGAALGVRRGLSGPGQEITVVKLVLIVAAWIAISTVLYFLVTAEFDIVLRLQMEGAAPLLLAFLLSLVQLALCIFLPTLPAICVTVVGIAWLTLAVSPGIYAIVLVALQATNLGGGLPLRPLVTEEAATICNLGIAQRPVVYRVPTGCEKKHAFAHLKTIVAQETAMKKAKVAAGWQRGVPAAPSTD